MIGFNSRGRRRIGTRIGRGVQGRPRLWVPKAAAAAAAIFGYTPEHGYTGDEASGDLTDHIGNDDLAATSLTYGVAKYPGGTLGVERNDGNDTAEASASSVWDHGTDSFGVVGAVYLESVGAIRSMFSKFASGAGVFSRMRDNDKLRVTIDDGTNSVRVTPDLTFVAGDTVFFAAARDATTDVLAMAVARAYGPVVASSVDASSVVDISNADSLSIGLGASQGQPGVDLFYYFFGGASANGMAADVTDIVERTRRWRGRAQ